jgi:glutathione synthase/RimK-type ligase-like ATP-grasp enzyme
MRLTEPDPDQAPLAAALASAGVEAALVAWDDPAADWDAAVPTVLRSTWNYARHLGAFLAWLERASAAAALWNPLEVVRENLRKRYLLALAARGVAVVPTTLVERGERAALPEVRFVLKPEVGAGSLDARVFDPGDPEAALHLAALTARGAALVQPYLDSVETHGERSLVWIDGELTHAIRKSPRFAGDGERVDGPYPITSDERELAAAALAPYAGRILYARVDVARDAAGRPRVMELELAEPSLFLAYHPPALERFVRGLRRRLL